MAYKASYEACIRHRSQKELDITTSLYIKVSRIRSNCHLQCLI